VLFLLTRLIVSTGILFLIISVRRLDILDREKIDLVYGCSNEAWDDPLFRLPFHIFCSFMLETEP